MYLFKPTVFCLILLGILNVAYSQNFEIYPDSTQWKTYFFYWDEYTGNCEYTCYEYVVKDTTIHNNPCQKIARKKIRSAGCNVSTIQYKYICHDTVSEKLFLYKRDWLGIEPVKCGLNDSVFFDYNLNIGDTLINSILACQEYLIIDSLDTVFMFGQTRKRWFFSISDTTFFIEGLGSNGGLTRGIWTFGFSPSQLLCIKDSSGEQYTSPLNSMNYYSYNYSPDYNCDSLHPLTMDIREASERKNDVSVWPSPARDHIKVSTQLKGEMMIELVDISGKTLFRKKSQFVSKGITLSVKDFRPGIYFMKFRSEKRVITKKIILQ